MNKKGFSLIEIIIALSLSFLMISMLYYFFINQKTFYQNTIKKLETNQSIRSAIFILEKEIKSAGLNPLKVDGIGIKKAYTSLIEFNLDLDEDGLTNSANENISFGFSGTYDKNQDGIADDILGSFGRNTGAGFFAIANNIHSIAFAYAYKENNQIAKKSNIIWAYDSNQDGFLDKELDTNDDGEITFNDLVGGSTLSPNIDIKDIVMVKVWILAIKSKSKFKKPYKFLVGSKIVEGEDFYEREIFTTTIKIRNSLIN